MVGNIGTNHRCEIRSGVPHPHLAEEVLRCRSVHFALWSARAAVRQCAELRFMEGPLLSDRGP